MKTLYQAKTVNNGIISIYTDTLFPGKFFFTGPAMVKASFAYHSIEAAIDAASRNYAFKAEWSMINNKWVRN